MAIGITNKILRQNKCHAAVCWMLVRNLNIISKQALESTVFPRCSAQNTTVLCLLVHKYFEIIELVEL